MAWSKFTLMSLSGIPGLIGLLCAFVGSIPVHAVDRQEITPLQEPAAVDIYDRFFFDDSSQTRNRIALEDTTQRHTINSPQDEDWMLIPVSRNSSYTIRVTNLGNVVDPHIQLLDENLQILHDVDQSASGTGQFEILNFSGTGSYYLVVKNAADAQYSPVAGDMNYEVSIKMNAAENVGIPTLDPLVGWVGSEGGTVPETEPAGFAAHVNAQTFPTGYDQVLLWVEPGTFAEETGIMISDPRDNWAFPTLELTEKWRTGERAESASVVWLTVYANQPEQAQFEPPLHLQLQMYDDALFYGFFPIDDIPDGKSPTDAQVWTWDGSEWVIFDPAPLVNGQVVTTSIYSLQWDERGFAEGYFGVFPSGDNSAIDSWTLY